MSEKRVHAVTPKQFPAVPRALLEALERLFPDRAPGRTDSEADIRFRAGSVHVVRHLRAQYDLQNPEP